MPDSVLQPAPVRTTSRLAEAMKSRRAPATRPQTAGAARRLPLECGGLPPLFIQTHPKAAASRRTPNHAGVSPGGVVAAAADTAARDGAAAGAPGARPPLLHCAGLPQR